MVDFVSKLFENNMETGESAGYQNSVFKWLLLLLLLLQSRKVGDYLVKAERSPDKMADPKSSVVAKMWTIIKKNLLIICLIVALILGVGLGAALRAVEPPFTTRDIFYLRFPGDLLMNMLQFLIVPLIISSLISGLSSLEDSATGRMGARAIVYYLSTTVAAVILGVVLAVTIQPGRRGGHVEENVESEERVVNTADTFLDLVRYVISLCTVKPLGLRRKKNIMGKGENAGYQHFLLFPQCFLKLFIENDKL